MKGECFGSKRNSTRSQILDRRAWIAEEKRDGGGGGGGGRGR